MNWDSLSDSSSFFVALLVLVFSVVLCFGCCQRGWCRCETELHGKTVIITGANSGIGKETAKELSRRGARIILACRDVFKAREALKEMEPLAKAELKICHIDLSSMKSVRSFAEKILEEEPRIDILINNAGLLCNKFITEDGFDTQMATNYLGPFFLTNLLLDRIRASAPSRIINLSSSGHKIGKIHWQDLNLNNKWFIFRSIVLYFQTNLAQVLFCAELVRKLAGSGVSVYVVHPGIVKTEFSQNDVDWLSSILLFFVELIGFGLFKSPLAGAQTTIHCAIAQALYQQKGLYYSNCKECSPHCLANDEKVCKKLWDVSESLVKLNHLETNIQQLKTLT